MKFLNKIFGIQGRGNKPAAEISEMIFGATDVGKERTNNEDYFLISLRKNLHIVADGMGGHNAGEIASLNATETINDYFTSELLSQIRDDEISIDTEMKQSLLKANQKILDMAKTNNAYYGMGCTVVVALINGNTLHLCHVGDARAYVCNEGGIQLLTTDHSKVMDLVKAGQITMEEARTSPLKNELSQAIGSPTPIVPDYNHCVLEDGDKVLLCSDGLWDMLSDEEIYEIVAQKKPAKILCEELVTMANDAGGHDNITVVLIEHRVQKEFSKTKDSVSSSGDASPDNQGE
jgi:serine/threonine protein phosphatase PrpC